MNNLSLDECAKNYAYATEYQTICKISSNLTLITPPISGQKIDKFLNLFYSTSVI